MAVTMSVCECYFNMQHAELKLRSIFEAVQLSQLHMAVCCATQLAANTVVCSSEVSLNIV